MRTVIDVTQTFYSHECFVCYFHTRTESDPTKFKYPLITVKADSPYQAMLAALKHFKLTIDPAKKIKVEELIEFGQRIPNCFTYFMETKEEQNEI